MKRTQPENKPGAFLEMLEQFLTVYIPHTKGYSEKTKLSYTTSFRLFVIYINELLNTSATAITFSMLSTDVIEGFLHWLETEKNNSVSTRNCRLAAIKSFAKYAENHDFATAGIFASITRKIEGKRTATQKRAYFTVQEVKIILDLPKLNTISGRRDAVLLHLMFVTGARAQEMCDLKVRDLQFLSDGRTRLSITGKGRKGRKIVVGDEITALLQKYIRYRKISESPDAYVFCTQNNPQMSVSCIEEIFKKYVRIAKEENPTMFLEKSYPPHSMRHTTAVCMLAAGVPISKIQVLFGHAQIDTTMIYAEITQPDLDNTVMNWSKNFWADTESDETPKISKASETDKAEELPDFLR